MTKLWTLGSLDDIMPDIDNCHVLCFACPDSQHAHARAVLSQAFDQIVQENSVLSGLVAATDDETARAGTKLLLSGENAPRSQLEIKDARDEIDLSYNELQSLGMPRRYLSAARVMPCRALGGAQTRATAMRVTFVKGGCFLVFCTSHALMDGMSVINVMAAFSSHARRISCQGATDAEDGAHPFPNRNGLLGPSDTDIQTLNPVVERSEYEKLKMNPRSWQMLGLDYRPKEESSVILAASLPPVEPVTRIFRIDSSGLRRLKDTCVHQISASGAAAWISTADALTALLWSSILYARTQDQSGPGFSDVSSTLMIAMDVRRLLKPPVSSTYIGNCVLYSRAELPLQLVSRSLSLGRIAQTVRASLHEAQQPEAIRETLELAASIPDVRSLSLLYPTWLANDVVISSIYGLPFYDLDFGRTFGDQHHPDFFRFPDGVFDGICFVLPRQRDGSAEIQVTMDHPHMQNLLQDQDFRRYFVDVA